MTVIEEVPSVAEVARLKTVRTRNQSANTKELRTSSSNRRAFSASLLSGTLLAGDARSESEVAMRNS